MNFEYQITADEYSACQSLYHRLKRGRQGVPRAFGWILVGVFLIVVAWNERPFDWAEFFLATIGIYWIYAGVVNLILSERFFRRAYPGSALAGQTFKAEINEDEFKVTGDLCSWQVRWQGVSLKGENKSAFMLYSQGTIFMFGKKYLTSEQQDELRKLSGLQHQNP